MKTCGLWAGMGVLALFFMTYSLYKGQGGETPSPPILSRQKTLQMLRKLSILLLRRNSIW